MVNDNRRCGSTNTETGEPCRNYARSCPWRFTTHKPQPTGTTARTERHLAASAEAPSPASPAYDSDNALPRWLADYVSDAEYGIHTNPRDFYDAMSQAQGKYPEDIQDHDIIRDTYMLSALWALSQKYPDGIVTVKNNRPRKGGGPFLARGRFIFVGGTALSSAHQIALRYSKDLDFLYVPTSQGNTKRNIIKRRHDIIKASARGVSSTKPKYFRSDGLVVQGVIPIAGHRRFITVDVVTRKEFCDTPEFVDRLELLEVEQMPLVSMLGRAAPSYLDAYPQLGGFSLPVVGEPYIAATKLDALSRRAVDTKLHHQIAYRWRDLYDLHCLARSDKASHITERMPEVCFFPENDSLRKVNYLRPVGGYGTSEVFKLGTPANDALRAGVEKEMRSIVWERPLPTFEEMVDSARSLDS